MISDNVVDRESGSVLPGKSRQRIINKEINDEHIFSVAPVQAKDNFR
jgi:hypothetical protein